MPYTLNIKFSPLTPPPRYGYRVKYWANSTPGVVTSAVTTGSSYQVKNLPETGYSGTVEPICAPDTYGAPAPFSVILAGGGNTVTASFGPCTQNAVEWHFFGSMTVPQNVLVNTPFRLDVVYYEPPNTDCSVVSKSVSMSGTIYAGTNAGTINGCALSGPQGEAFLVGSVVCSSVGILT